MNSLKLLLTVWFGFSFQIFTAAQCNLEIEIWEIRNNEGRIMLQLLDKDQKVIQQFMSEIDNKKCTISINSLASGKYAVRYYHDENINGIMETTFVGKPTEGYGFSNNVTGKFGAPAFDKWLFEIKRDSKITLKPTY